MEDGAGRRYACKESSDFQMLKREAEFQSAVRHPLFPCFFDIWREGDVGKILMEYVPGENLEILLRRRGALGRTQTIRVGMELAEGLLYLHERSPRVLFRDVKPSNVLIGQDGRARLLDFGCACYQGRVKNIAGTPGFAAPEQLSSGIDQTMVCDVYGLGKTLEAMLGNGNSRQLQKVIGRCTAERAEERLPDMRAVLEMLSASCNRRRGEKVDSVGRAMTKGKLTVQKNIRE